MRRKELYGMYYMVRVKLEISFSGENLCKGRGARLDQCDKIQILFCVRAYNASNSISPSDT
jgi:hypothetical protein